MKRVRLVIAYDGTDYCGWQIQPNGITVEEVLNKTIEKVTGESCCVIGASRTDSGVHARGNVAVFDTCSTIPPERMAHALNRKLPKDIVIRHSDEVEPSWHPRYQERILKRYSYHIWNAAWIDPLRSRYCAHVSFPLDIEKMEQGAGYLLGTHDFVSFCNIHTQVRNTVRRIDEIRIQKAGSEITIQVCGNGFLYHMVRIIAGTLIRVGRGFYPPERVGEILEQKLRTEAGVTAPPEGLVLEEICYDSQEESGRIKKGR